MNALNAPHPRSLTLTHSHLCGAFRTELRGVYKRYLVQAGRLRYISSLEILHSPSYSSSPRFLHFGASHFSAHLTLCHFTCARRAKCCTHWVHSVRLPMMQASRARKPVHAVCASVCAFLPMLTTSQSLGYIHVYFLPKHEPIAAA